MKIKVKREHIVAARCLIDNGADWRSKCCPVAVALCCAGFDDPAVAPSHITLRGLPYAVPRSVARFVRKFDSGKPVKPFTFELDLDGGKL